MKAADFLTHIDNKEDAPYLRTPLFQVNLRLLKNSFSYRVMMLNVCHVIKELALSDYEDYKKPHGTSGANAGIPFNIIGIVRNRGMVNEYCQIMINPKILRTGKSEVKTTSNCGSIRLEKPIEVKRWELITVEWYEITAKGDVEQFIEQFGPETGSFTIQHEIDHNNGILIIDREVKQD